MGRSYGDAALPAEEKDHIILSASLDRLIDFDQKKGCLTAEAGVSLQTILSVFQPYGWFLPTTPGSKFISLGGAVAADVHGKNHHRDGSFGEYVKAITLITPDGKTHELTPEKNPAWFWATVGGMGLTGFITKVTFQLIKVPSAWYWVTYEKANNIEAAMCRMEEEKNKSRYTVAWVDGLAGGAHLGRSILMLGNHANPNELPHTKRLNPWACPPNTQRKVPFDFPQWFLNPHTARIFNQLFYWNKSVKTESLEDYESFFYPLDTIGGWNRLYGKRGFIQFQAIFPNSSAAQGLRRVLEAVSCSRLASFLAVLKKCGPSGKGFMSFPIEGYTLALDIPNVGSPLKELHKKLENIVLQEGGRIYLAKDTLCTGKGLNEMYPKLNHFNKIRSSIDPEKKIRSRLSKRFHLTD